MWETERMIIIALNFALLEKQNIWEVLIVLLKVNPNFCFIIEKIE